MSDLHARLLAAASRTVPVAAPNTVSVWDVNRAFRALRAAVELHAPVKLPLNDVTWYCCGCGNLPQYPCSTIQTIARELGVLTEGDDRG